jgi:hypothetical protein
MGVHLHIQRNCTPLNIAQIIGELLFVRCCRKYIDRRAYIYVDQRKIKKAIVIIDE